MAREPENTREDFATTALPLMDQLYTAAFYLTRDRADADDLLQETYLRAYRFWRQFTPGTNCKAWMLTIMHNLFRNRYRERQRAQRVIEFDETLFDPDPADEWVTAEATPEERVLANVLDGEVEAALAGLPAEFLEAVLLVDLQELTYEEAAEVVGCPVGTIRSRLSRGRRLLQKRLYAYAKERGLLR